MRISKKWIIATTSFLALSSFFFYWYKNIHPYLQIKMARVEALSIAIHTDLVGRITQMGPVEGDFVKKGASLFTIDPDCIGIKYDQTQTSIALLEMELEREKKRIGQAMDAYLMATTELQFGIGSADEVKKQLEAMDEAQEKSQMAASHLNDAKAELRSLGLELQKITIMAPFDGVILKQSKNLGAVVAFGDPVYVLCDNQNVWIEAEVEESAIRYVSLGTEARISLTAYPNQKWLGKITYIGSATTDKISPIANEKKNPTIPIKISLESPSSLFKPGLTATVALKVR